MGLSEIIVTAAKPISTSTKILKPLSIAGKVEYITSLAIHGAKIASDLLNSAITVTEVGNITGHLLPTVTIAAEKTKFRNYNIKDAQNGLQAVYNKYGEKMSTNVERIYRLETAHFRSIQYRRTGTGGMEVHGSVPIMDGVALFFLKILNMLQLVFFQSMKGKV